MPEVALRPNASNDAHAEIEGRSSSRRAISGKLEVHGKVRPPLLDAREEAEELGLRRDDEASDLPMGNIHAVVVAGCFVAHTLSV
jgi:hypothetical protein